MPFDIVENQNIATAFGEAIFVLVHDDKYAFAAATLSRFDNKLVQLDQLVLNLFDFVLSAHHVKQLRDVQPCFLGDEFGPQLVVHQRKAFPRVVSGDEIHVALVHAEDSPVVQNARPDPLPAHFLNTANRCSSSNRYPV